MSVTTIEQNEQDLPPITACTLSSDIEKFDLLIHDMETLLGNAWGDLRYSEGLDYLDQPDAEHLEILVLALESEEQSDVTLLGQIVTRAKAQNIGVVLVANDAGPATLHHLLRCGADEFVPYPLPEGELEAAISRIRNQANETQTIDDAEPPTPARSRRDRLGSLFAVQGVAGGVGATTLAVNLANELSIPQNKKEQPPSVCLIDLSLQNGAVATYLDLPQREAVIELLSDTAVVDSDSFQAALASFEGLSVLTAPGEIVPLDLVGPEDIQRILDIALGLFDFVVVDLPATLVHWSETVLNMADIYFAVMKTDMRSIQNTVRLRRLFRSEDMPLEKVQFVINFAPKFTDLTNKSRVSTISELLETQIKLLLPDGGRAVTPACDRGQPLSQVAQKSPLRKEIAKLAQTLRSHQAAEETEV